MNFASDIVNNLQFKSGSVVKWVNGIRKGGVGTKQSLYNPSLEDYQSSRAFSNVELSIIYKKLKAVRISVNRVAGDLSSLPYKIVKIQHNGKVVEMDKFGDPRWSWIEKPNPYMNGRFFRNLQWMYKGIHGAMNCEIPGGVDRVFKQVYPIMPHMLIVMQKGNRIIDHFEIDDDAGNTRQVLRIDEVARFYEPDPEDYVLPHAPLNSCRYEIQGLFKAMGYNLSFFDNAATPTLGVTTDEMLGDDEYDRWRTGILKAFSGFKRGGSIVTADAGATITPFGFSPVESGYLDTINKYEQGIVLQNKLNPALIDPKNVNRSNLTEIMKMHYEQLQSDTDKFDEMMTGIINEQGIRYVTDFSQVPSLQKDAQKLSSQLSKQFQDGVITVNEYRTKLGMPADPKRGGLYYNQLTPQEKDASPIE